MPSENWAASLLATLKLRAAPRRPAPAPRKREPEPELQAIPRPQPMRLTIEMVPQPLWGENFAHSLNKEEWDRVRKACYAKANWRCEICDAPSRDENPIECHEIWHYDDQRFVHTLTGMTGICRSCHQVKHFGRSRAHGLREIAYAHAIRVNGCTPDAMDAYIAAEEALWSWRSAREWTQDLSWFETVK